MYRGVRCWLATRLSYRSSSALDLVDLHLLSPSGTYISIPGPLGKGGYAMLLAVPCRYTSQRTLPRRRLHSESTGYAISQSSKEILYSRASLSPAAVNRQSWPAARVGRRCTDLDLPADPAGPPFGLPSRFRSATTALRRRSGSRSSSGNLLEHVDIQGLFGDHLLQPRVLALEFLQRFGVLGSHAAVLVLPAMPGRLWRPRGACSRPRR